MSSDFIPIQSILPKKIKGIELQKNFKQAFLIKGFNYNQWTALQNQLLAENKIKNGTKIFWQLLQALGDANGHSYYGQNKLAKFLGKKIRTIQRYQSELIKYGWLKVTPGTEYRSNNYYVIWPPNCPNPKLKSAINKSKINGKGY